MAEGSELRTGEPAPDRAALKRRLVHSTNLPTLPGVALQIVELARNPEVGLAEVAEVMGRDPALATKVLRMANSPVYSRQRKIENVRQALVLFGLDGALTVALSFSVATVVRDASSGGRGLDYAHFWRRSLSSAAAGSLVGRQAGLQRAEDLFLAGLIQDIGMAALDRALPELYGELGDVQYDHRALLAAEAAVAGANHGEATAWMLEHWGFPEHLVAMIQASHGGDVQALEGAPVEARALFVAADLADAWWSPDRQGALAGCAERADRLLEFGQEALLALVEQLAEEIHLLSQLMETDLGDAAFLAAMADEARELLMLRNLRNIRRADDLEERTRELEEEAQTDPLTGVGNRGRFDEVLASEFEAARAQKWPLSLVLIDLDHFKRVNDELGHQAGDQVLCQVAQAIRSCIRESDCLARYGGEEFGIVLPGTPLEGAVQVCERILEAVRSASRPVAGRTLRVTVSIGLAALDAGTDMASQEDLVAAADKALYAAKRGGRDRLEVFGLDR